MRRLLRRFAEHPQKPAVAIALVVGLFFWLSTAAAGVRYLLRVPGVFGLEGNRPLWGVPIMMVLSAFVGSVCLWASYNLLLHPKSPRARGVLLDEPD